MVRRVDSALLDYEETVAVAAGEGRSIHISTTSLDFPHLSFSLESPSPLLIP